MRTDFFLLSNLIQEELKKYYNKTTAEIESYLGVDLKGKSSNNRLFRILLEKSKHFDTIKSLLDRGNYEIKTISLEWNDNIKESMSLKTFEYCDIFNETWEKSSLRLYFDINVFIFVIFKKDFKNVYLESVKFWKMPVYILDNDVKKVWEHTKSIIAQGQIVNYIDSKGRFKSNFLTSSNTKVLHVRPHARNKDDSFKLPVQDRVTKLNKFTKHSFWINSSFIKKVVVDDKYYE